MSKLKQILSFLPAILWYGLIWSLSDQPADVSTDVSHGVTGNMLATGDILASGSGNGSGYTVANEYVQMAVKELLSFFIRKGAHMFLFFVLAILIWFASTALIQKRPLRTLCTLLPCTALAALDEFHQTFVPGRSGEVRDVLVDLAGSLIAMLLFAMPVVGLWLCSKVRHPDRLWITGASCGAVLLVYVGLLTGIAPFFVPRILNSPFFVSLPEQERAALIAGAAPILKQLLYLLACAVTGFLSLFLAVLTGHRRTVITAFAAALALSLAAGIVWTLPAFAGAVLCLLGGGAALLLRIGFPLLNR